LTHTGAIDNMRNHALEEAIRRAPDDLDAYEVYADWLIERGEPQGELILFDVRRKRSGTTTDFDVLAAEARILRDRRQIFGELGVVPREHVEWDIELGFLKALRIHADGEDAGRALRLALSHRVGAFLRELAVQKKQRLGSPVVSELRSTTRSIWDAILEVGLPSTLEAVALPLLSDDMEAQCHALAHVSRCVFPLRNAPTLAPHLPSLRALKSLTFTASKHRNELLLDALQAHAELFAGIERLELAIPYRNLHGFDLAPLRAAIPHLVVDGR
jgi:uncharacterized protein (TIGR02996 family)